MVSFEITAPLMLMATLTCCGPVVPTKPLASEAVTRPGVSAASAEDCAIFAAVAKSELLIENGRVSLPTSPEVSPRLSLAERHATYAVRMTEAYAGTLGMKDFQPLARWIEREETELSILYPSLVKTERVAIVKQRAFATTGLRVDCNWTAHLLKFEAPKSDGAAFRPWLSFGRPYLARRGRLAFVDISFAYTPTFAREGQCAVERHGGNWRVAKCHYRLMS